MLNEPASLLGDDANNERQRLILPTDPGAPEDERQRAELREIIEQVLRVERERFLEDSGPAMIPGAQDDAVILTNSSRLLASYEGQLLVASTDAYRQLEAAFSPRDIQPVLRRHDSKDVVHLILGRVVPAQGGGWLSLVLFVLTALSMLTVGMNMALSHIYETDPARANELVSRGFTELWRGLPYTLSLLLILGAHELGHYFMSRRHKVAASLPYFIPSPLPPFGTFGAAIRLREPMPNRKILFDIGAAGPIAGLIFAIPILLIGLETSPVREFSSGYVEGNSILYALAKLVIFERFLPAAGEDVIVNQLAWAGWTGLFVTGLNLIPLGQLDGGHILYSAIGNRARVLYYPAIVALVILTVLTQGAMFFMLLLLLFLGRVYATPLDDVTPLDPARRRLAALMLVVFLLVFVPVPLTPVEAAEPGPIQPGGTVWLMLALVFAQQSGLAARIRQRARQLSARG
jgi:membrane-associated protease RseP (regulator of RpoE activity)